MWCLNHQSLPWTSYLSNHLLITTIANLRPFSHFWCWWQCYIACSGHLASLPPTSVTAAAAAHFGLYCSPASADHEQFLLAWSRGNLCLHNGGRAICFVCKIIFYRIVLTHTQAHTSLLVLLKGWQTAVGRFKKQIGNVNRPWLVIPLLMCT